MFGLYSQIQFLSVNYFCKKSSINVWQVLKHASPFFDSHSVKNVGIRSFSGPYFPAFGLNTDQKNSEYGNF